MRLKLYALISLCCVAPCSASDWDERPAQSASTPNAIQQIPQIDYRFKNIPLGITLEQMRQLPFAGGELQPGQQVFVDCGERYWKFPPQKCQCKYVLNDRWNSPADLTVAGYGVRLHWFEFVQHQGQYVLSKIVLCIKSEQFAGIAQAYINKFGKPTSIKTDDLTTRIGARYTNCEMKWSNGTTEMRVEKYLGNIEDGIITYSLIPLEQAQDKADLQKRTDDL